MTCLHPETKTFWGWTDLLKRFDFKKLKLWREICCECRETVREWTDEGKMAG